MYLKFYKLIRAKSLDAQIPVSVLYYAWRLLDSFLLKKVACVQPRPDISTHYQELRHGFQMTGGIEQALSLAESSEVILDHIGGSSVPSQIKSRISVIDSRHFPLKYDYFCRDLI